MPSKIGSGSVAMPPVTRAPRKNRRRFKCFLVMSATRLSQHRSNEPEPVTGNQLDHELSQILALSFELRRKLADRWFLFLGFQHSCGVSIQIADQTGRGDFVLAQQLSELDRSVERGAVEVAAHVDRQALVR